MKGMRVEIAITAAAATLESTPQKKVMVDDKDGTARLTGDR
jgi:hypothetical protein